MAMHCVGNVEYRVVVKSTDSIIAKRICLVEDSRNDITWSTGNDERTGKWIHSSSAEFWTPRSPLWIKLGIVH